LIEEITTPFDGETPRRDAVLTMGAASAALFGLLGLSVSTEARGKHHSASSEKKGKKKHNSHKIGLSSALSDPFTLTANNGVTRKATCPLASSPSAAACRTRPKSLPPARFANPTPPPTVPAGMSTSSALRTSTRHCRSVSSASAARASTSSPEALERNRHSQPGLQEVRHLSPHRRRLQVAAGVAGEAPSIGSTGGCIDVP
jgi:hypothetical protein